MANFLIIGICFLAGIALRKLNKLPAATPAVLNTYVIYIALPALAVKAIHSASLTMALLPVIAMPWLLFGGAAAVFHFVARRSGWDASTVACLILTAGLGNTSFLGIPMIEVFYGSKGIPMALVLDQAGTFLALSTVGIYIAARGAGSQFTRRQMAFRIFTFPPLLSLIAAILLQPVELHPAIIQTLDRLGATLAPTALLSVGYQLRLSHIKQHATPAAWGLGYKMIIAPAVIALLYALFMPLHTLEYNITIFEAAMPPMITGAIIAADYHHKPELAALMTGLGIILSFVTLSGWWWLLLH